MKCDQKQFKERITKISGQAAAIDTMCSEGRSADEILQQIVAVRASLSSLAKLIVEAEVRGCLLDAGSDKPVSKLVDTLFKVT